MKPNKRHRIYDKSIILIGIILGLAGGLIMVLLSRVDFGLGYFHGYLFIINYVTTIIISLILYKKVGKDNSTYLKRMMLGFLTYSVTTIFYFLYVTTFQTIGVNNTLIENLSLTIVFILLGLFFSAILAFAIKPGNLEKRRIKNNYT